MYKHSLESRRLESTDVLGLTSNGTKHSLELIAHPKFNKPNSILRMERNMRIQTLIEKQKKHIFPNGASIIPLPYTEKCNPTSFLDEISTSELNMQIEKTEQMNGNVVEDMRLPLQKLSMRSSTPYTPSLMSRTSKSCDLEQDSHHLSPVKETAVINKFAANSCQNGSDSLLLSNKLNVTNLNLKTYLLKTQMEPKITTYTRSRMLGIRNEMAKTHPQETLIYVPRIATCDDIELEVRLRRLNLWHDIIVNNKAGGLKIRNVADCMPTFYKNIHKTTDTQIITDQSIIKSQPPQPEYKRPAITMNQRRIGSGRLHQPNFTLKNSEFSNCYNRANTGKKYVGKEAHGNSSVQQFFENESLTDSKRNMPSVISRENSFSAGNQHHNNINYDIQQEESNSSNSNYVKRVMSGFLVVSNPKSREADEKYHRRYKNQIEEPEWFSCGPTSRLDTIELCGFDEDEQNNSKNEHELKTDDIDRHNVEENKSQSINETQKKLLHSSDGDNGNDAHDSQKLSHDKSSKFMPFFDGKKRNKERRESSSSLQEFFQKVKTIHNQSTNDKKASIQKDIMSVDQLEAAYRRDSLNDNIKHQQNSLNNSNSHGVAPTKVENFQRLIGTLNKSFNTTSANINGHSNTVSQNMHKLSEKRLLSQQHYNYGSNVLTNFIYQQQQYQHQQHKQQIVMQQQQQQALFFANLQLRTTLGRPDTQLLLMRLAKGEISKHGLLVQLANPRLTMSDREAITGVLQFTNYQQQQQQYQHQLEMVSSSLFTNQLQHLNILQQTLAARKQQTQLSQPQAQVSQEDLQTHTNLIMQNAVMKRKLEEQSSKLFQSNSAGILAKQQTQARPQKQQSSHLPSSQISSNTVNSNQIIRNFAEDLIQAKNDMGLDSNNLLSSVQMTNKTNKSHQNGSNAMPQMYYCRNLSYKNENGEVPIKLVDEIDYQTAKINPQQNNSNAANRSQQNQ